MKLTYDAVIPGSDLVGRLLGPDGFGGVLQVVAVAHIDGKTEARCRPVPPDELAYMTRDEFGQWWLPV